LLEGLIVPEITQNLTLGKKPWREQPRTQEIHGLTSVVMVKRRSGGGGVAVARGHLILVLALAEDPKSTEVKKDWMEGSPPAPPPLPRRRRAHPASPWASQPGCDGACGAAPPSPHMRQSCSRRRRARGSPGPLVVLLLARDTTLLAEPSALGDRLSRPRMGRRRDGADERASRGGTERAPDRTARKNM